MACGDAPEDDHRVLAHRVCAGAEAAQPAAHGGARDAQIRADPRGPGAVHR
jgi:hypothetical protein